MRDGIRIPRPLARSVRRRARDVSSLRAEKQETAAFLGEGGRFDRLTASGRRDEDAPGRLTVKDYL